MTTAVSFSLLFPSYSGCLFAAIMKRVESRYLCDGVFQHHQIRALSELMTGTLLPVTFVALRFAVSILSIYQNQDQKQGQDQNHNQNTFLFQRKLLVIADCTVYNTKG